MRNYKPINIRWDWISVIIFTIVFGWFCIYIGTRHDREQEWLKVAYRDVTIEIVYTDLTRDTISYQAYPVRDIVSLKDGCIKINRRGGKWETIACSVRMFNVLDVSDALNPKQ